MNSQLFLAYGPETLLADRVVETTSAALKAQSSDLVVESVEAVEIDDARFSDLFAPSLFGEARAVVIRNLQDLDSEMNPALLAYIADPDPTITVIALHKGGVKGKALLEALRKAGARETPCEAMKRDSDKIQFLRTEALLRGRKISPDAAKALVDAIGSDLRELANSLSQLIADTAGEINIEAVERFHGGRIEATGFDVTDALLEGRAGDALATLRHALDTGTDPVMITSALAGALRTLARVGSAPRSLRSAELAGQLGMAPWQIDKARRQLPGWTGAGIAAAITEVARADGAVKGGGADPVFALERALIAIARSRT